jgi:L-amino acid N-acyltransferase YncA
MEQFTIRNARIEDVEGFNVCVGAVAAERKYIGHVEAPLLEDSRKWMQSVLDAGYPFVVASAGATIVGWCDVGPRDREGFRHTAELGMGLRADARGHGLGPRMLERAIELSRKCGIEKLELRCYASNVTALRLYEKSGFVVEGTRVRGRKLDGVYDDVVLLGMFLTT